MKKRRLFLFTTTVLAVWLLAACSALGNKKVVLLYNDTPKYNHALSSTDADYISSIFESDDWVKESTQINSYHEFDLNGNRIRYSISEGILNDVTNNRYMVLSKEQQDYINSTIIGVSSDGTFIGQPEKPEMTGVPQQPTKEPEEIITNPTAGPTEEPIYPTMEPVDTPEPTPGPFNDISLEFKDIGNGTYVTAEHPINMEFGPDLSIKVTSDIYNLNLVIKAVVNDEGALKSVLSPDRRKLRYSLDEVTDISYSLDYTGFLSLITVGQYTGQTEYSFYFYTNGLRMDNEMEEVWLYDSEGKMVVSLGCPIVFTADERNNAFTVGKVETIVENSEYKYTIALDSLYLSDEKTAYPLTMDGAMTCYK